MLLGRQDSACCANLEVIRRKTCLYSIGKAFIRNGTTYHGGLEHLHLELLLVIAKPHDCVGHISIPFPQVLEFPVALVFKVFQPVMNASLPPHIM
jgi:hypothetical protein